MIHVLLAPGFEEIEAVTPIDVLRRAKLDVCVVAVTRDGQQTHVNGAHGLKIQCDQHIDEVDLFSSSLIILPGGMPGTTHLGEPPAVKEALIQRMAKDLPIAAICAAPSILGELGLLHGRRATCYPGLEDKLIGALISHDAVVTDKALITSQGPGTAVLFALTLIQKFVDAETAVRVAKGLLIDSY